MTTAPCAQCGDPTDTAAPICEHCGLDPFADLVECEHCHGAGWSAVQGRRPWEEHDETCSHCSGDGEIPADYRQERMDAFRRAGLDPQRAFDDPMEDGR